jgi:hypothetical protein
MLWNCMRRPSPQRNHSTITRQVKNSHTPQSQVSKMLSPSSNVLSYMLSINARIRKPMIQLIQSLCQVSQGSIKDSPLPNAWSRSDTKISWLKAAHSLPYFILNQYGIYIKMAIAGVIYFSWSWFAWIFQEGRSKGGYLGLVNVPMRVREKSLTSLDMRMYMDQFGRYNFKWKEWLRNLSFLPAEIEFQDDRSLNIKTFIEEIEFLVHSLGQRNSVRIENFPVNLEKTI